MNYKRCWITLNRNCNLRCSWCYASSTNYDLASNMDFNCAKRLIDICFDIGINNFVLIGGEPTLYEMLFDVIKYIKSKKGHVAIITNGILLSNEEYIKKLKNTKVDSLSISLKGEDKKSFYNVTGIDLYESQINGIKMALKYGFKFSVSMVLTEKNIPSYISAIKYLFKIGVKHFHFSFCYTVNNSGQKMNYLKPSLIIDKYIDSYNDLYSACQGKFELFNGYPLCLWPKSFLKKTIRDNTFNAVCQLLKLKGLVFDTDGTLLPCNALMNFKIGKFNEDFSDSASLISFLEKDNIKDIYNKLIAVPDKRCLQCNSLKYCGGGCVCNWTNYSLEDLENGEIRWEISK